MNAADSPLANPDVVDVRDAAGGGSDEPGGGREVVAGGSDEPGGGREVVAGGSDEPGGGREVVAGGSDEPGGGREVVAGGSDDADGRAAPPSARTSRAPTVAPVATSPPCA